MTQTVQPWINGVNQYVNTLTFTNNLGLQSLTAVTTNAGSLTGGTTSATVATPYPGSGPGTAGGEFSQAYLVADAYFSGTFNTADLPTLTDAIVAAFGGRYVRGSIAGGGIVRIP